MNRTAGLPAALCVLLSTSCVYLHVRQGDDNRWRDDHGFERGRTGIGDVLRALGPPVQVLDLGSRTAFLYVLAEQRTDGVDVAKLITDTERSFLSDRAVYFFDDRGVLEEMAMSRVELPRESEYREAAWTDYRVAEIAR